MGASARNLKNAHVMPSDFSGTKTVKGIHTKEGNHNYIHKLYK